jgi:hypothetical protein
VTTTDARLTILVPVLRKILKAIAPAGVPVPSRGKLSHFTETVLIQEGVLGRAVFTVTDGYRMHRVELLPVQGVFTLKGTMVVGLTWLNTLAKTARDEVTIEASLHPDVEYMGKAWEVIASTWSGQEPLSIGHDRFAVGEWPDIDKLLPPDGTVEEAVGFNPRFFSDMVKAMLAWWGKQATPDASFPLIVRLMRKDSPSVFTLRNELGTLTVVLMPRTDVEEDDL